MVCFLQNFTLYLLLFQPQSATDELIPPAPEKDSWDFRKGSGWVISIYMDGTAIIRGLTTFSPTPDILQLSRTWKNPSEYSAFPQKLSVFPRTRFSYINSCKVCSHGGRELVWTSFHSLLQVQAVPFIIHVCVNLSIPFWMEICLFCCLIPPFWKFSKYPLTHLTSTTCIHRLIHSKFLSLFSGKVFF